MKRLACLGLAVWPLLPCPAGGQTIEKALGGGPRFEKLQYESDDGAVLPYRLLKPSNLEGAAEKHPLLLFLHGAGERGTDNEAQLRHGKVMLLSAAERYGSFVLAPQCPPGRKWVEVDWNQLTHQMPEEPSRPMRLTLELIGKLCQQYPIDRERLYVMGLSMGGYGSWDIIQRQPQLFAAAVPICGGGDQTRASRIEAAVWAFHGGQDQVVPVARSRRMIAAMKAAGKLSQYTEYPGVGHNCWDAVFRDPTVLDWLFSQKRSHPKTSPAGPSEESAR